MENSKILPVAVGVAGVGFLVYAIVQGNNAKKSTAFLDGTTNVDNFNANDIATTLYNAMKEADFTNTTKRKTIITALTGVSQAQFGLVIRAFGYKNYNTLTGNQYFAIWQTPKKYSLKTWLKEELDSNDYNLLKINYPKYL